MTEKFEHSFYIVKTDDGKYFAGFDADEGVSRFVDNPLAAKMFMGKNNIKLRHNERMVEVYVEFSEENCKLSEPFRPRRRPQ